MGATDLLISADGALTQQAVAAVSKCRGEIEGHIRRRPEFLRALEPLRPVDSPPVVAAMYAAAEVAGVGPMAAVAGAVAEYVGRDLLQWSKQVIVENGGDIFLSSTAERLVAIHAGTSPFSGRVALAIPAGRTPVGVCTSSATVGHSLSFGRADAATVVAADAALADALATATCNRIQQPDDIEPTLEWVLGIRGVCHAAIVLGDRLGTRGDLELRPISGGS